MVEKSGVGSSWLKSPGLNGLGLKLGVEKSGVEMSFNLFNHFVLCSTMNESTRPE